MEKEKKDENRELPAAELAWLQIEVERIDGIYGTAACDGGITTLTQHKESKAKAALAAEQLGDPFLMDLTPVDPFLAALREGLAASGGEEYDGE